MLTLLGKVPVYLLLIHSCFEVIVSYEENARLYAELQLADLELADECEDLSNGMKLALFHKNYAEKISSEQAYGHLLRLQSKNLLQFSNIPSEVERNWTFLVKPGDGLLSEDEWNALVSFHNANEELVSTVKVPCVNNTEGCIFTKEEYQTILKNSKDVDILNQTWSAWQHVLIPNKEANFSSILSLVKKASLLNEKDDGRSYWEFLTDFDGAYSKAKEFWEEIKPLYTKLHEFVKIRLYNHYHLNDSLTEIPVSLLGNNFGNDWSHIADIILPHPQLHYDAESFLKYKDVKDIYSLAENLTNSVSLGKLGNRFWLNSKFNLTFCEPHILTFCSQEYTELYDCNVSTWTTYLDAHETVFKIALMNQDYTSLMRQKLRYSAIDDAVATLGPLLAIESLVNHGIVNKDIFNSTDENDPVYMTKLLLTALRTLPKLPYYLAADEWRLKELEDPSKNVATSWWEYRKEYQGVKGVTNEEYDFLRDKYITSNKPYLSKFFGEVLAFQFMDFYRSQMTDFENNLAEQIGKDPNFLSMVTDRASTDWSYLLTLNYGFDISASPLLEYFQPLERYLQNAPLQQVPIRTTTTTSTTTPKIISTSFTENVIQKELIPNTNLSYNDSVLSDEPKINSTQRGTSNKNTSGDIPMYAGVGLFVVVCCMLVVAYGYKHVRRRRRTNNRRFAT